MRCTLLARFYKSALAFGFKKMNCLTGSRLCGPSDATHRDTLWSRTDWFLGLFDNRLNLNHFIPLPKKRRIQAYQRFMSSKVVLCISMN